MSNDKMRAEFEEYSKAEQERLRHNRAYFEEGCACIHKTKTLQPCPVSVPNTEAVAFYEQNCKCSRNFTTDHCQQAIEAAGVRVKP